MAGSYQYPLDLTWSADEMATVVAFFADVERFYEDFGGAEKADSREKDHPSKTLSVDKFARFAAEFRVSYQAFKKIVPSKAQEKQLDREFEATSGYSIYRAVKALVKDKKIV